MRFNGLPWNKRWRLLRQVILMSNAPRVGVRGCF